MRRTWEEERSFFAHGMFVTLFLGIFEANFGYNLVRQSTDITDHSDCLKELEDERHNAGKWYRTGNFSSVMGSMRFVGYNPAVNPFSREPQCSN